MRLGGVRSEMWWLAVSRLTVVDGGLRWLGQVLAFCAVIFTQGFCYHFGLHTYNAASAVNGDNQQHRSR